MRKILLLVFLFFCTEFLAISENKVAIIYSAGGLGDEGYNDLAHKALNKAKFDLGIDFDYYEPIDPVKETERQLMTYSDSKSYDLIITVGFLSKSSLEKAAKEYPNQKYAIVDEIVFDSKNITSITFNVEEESFLAGAVAALMTKTDKVAFIGGTEAPLITRYKAGFEQGAKYVKPDVEVLVSYIGGYNSFNDPKKAEQITNELIRENTDVFYHAAGASNRGIVNSAKKYGKYVIEVDSYSDWQNEEVVIASAVKNIDVAVYDIIKKLTDNTLENKTYIYGAKEEGIGIVIKAEEKIGIKKLKIIKKITDLLKSGEIKADFSG